MSSHGVLMSVRHFLQIWWACRYLFERSQSRASSTLVIALQMPSLDDGDSVGSSFEFHSCSCLSERL